VTANTDQALPKCSRDRSTPAMQRHQLNYVHNLRLQAHSQQQQKKNTKHVDTKKTATQYDTKAF